MSLDSTLILFSLAAVDQRFIGHIKFRDIRELRQSGIPMNYITEQTNAYNLLRNGELCLFLCDEVEEAKHALAELLECVYDHAVLP